MTTLYERLLGIGGSNIPVDNYVSCCAEQRRGNMTRQEIIDAFTLTGAQANDHDDVISRMSSIILPLGSIEMRDSLIIAEGGQKPLTEAQLKTRWGIS
jgi:hypothetical protein